MNTSFSFIYEDTYVFSKNTWGVDVNNAWPLTFKASSV